jgi:hypothetical protein
MCQVAYHLLNTHYVNHWFGIAVGGHPVDILRAFKFGRGNIIHQMAVI